jgi:hypothetical protein
MAVTTLLATDISGMHRDKPQSSLNDNRQSGPPFALSPLNRMEATPDNWNASCLFGSHLVQIPILAFQLYISFFSIQPVLVDE